MRYLKTAIFLLFLFYLYAVLTTIRDRIIVYPRSGLASWYTARQTASGEKFNSLALTCAMRDKDYGRRYRVCNKENGKCVVVRHNDWGPQKHLFNEGRIIDLSKTAFLEIADLKEGIIKVTVSLANKD